MNRKNFWTHFGIAMLLIGMAAIIGQIVRWEASLSNSPKYSCKMSSKPLAVKRSDVERQPEVLVKFRSDVTLNEIKKIIGKNNDRIEDVFQQEKGWFSIDDLDNKEMEVVAEQYRAMSNVVEFAEANNEISLDDPANFAPAERFSYENPVNPLMPNDPMFNEQWALNNAGQSGGKEKADIRALLAWAKTQGSSEVVVAVLDSGVDYTHPDLVGNMWFRPDNVPQYKDNELGTVNDLRGFNAADNQSDPMDDNGHGTHCSGIIGAEGDNDEGIAGINWQVQIMPLKFMGRGGFGTTKDAIEAINYAIDRKQKGVNVRVINASWGSTSHS